MKAIFAISHNYVLGHNNGIPWKCPLDIKHFKETTSGHIVVMGRKTWDSLDPKHKPLPNRINIVISSKEVKDCDYWIDDPQKLFELVKILDKEKEVFIIGGKQIYDFFIPHCDEIIRTIIYKTFEGNVSAPNIPTDFKCVSIKWHHCDYNNAGVKIHHFKKI